MPDIALIGQRIRDERKRRNLTLQELSDRVNLSIPYLSQIENGKVNININTLEEIGHALDVPLLFFVVDENPADVSAVRFEERRWFQLGKQASESILMKSRGNLEICVIRLNPGSERVDEEGHSGEEFTYVLQGNVRMELNDGYSYEINSGDLLYYKSNISHSWSNIGDTTAELLVVNTPATF